MKVILMHNPKAGSKEPSKDEIIGVLKNNGYLVEYKSAKKSKISKLEEESGDIIVIAGGDGTIGQITRKLIGKNITIGVLPLGTANNIAKSLGVSGDYASIISNWGMTKKKRYSVCKVEGPWNKLHFIESLGFGLLPDLMENFSVKAKKQKSKVSTEEEVKLAREYLLEKISNVDSDYYEIKIDNKDFSGKYILVEIMNIKSVGPNLVLAPEADPEDDSLDIILIKEEEKSLLTSYIQDLIEKNSSDLKLPNIKGKSISINSKNDHVHIDDKIYDQANKGPIYISILDSYLEFLSGE